MTIDKFNVEKKFSQFSEHWSPKNVAELNGQELKLVKIKGEFPWHKHEQEDELFFVWEGSIFLEFRDTKIELNKGEGLVVPKGVEHRPVAEDEAKIILFEPKGVLNTGNIVDEIFTAPKGVKI